ncbi:MAG: hypothetical protein R2874_05175 [Desulfobacterales bacterium]
MKKEDDEEFYSVGSFSLERCGNPALGTVTALFLCILPVCLHWQKAASWPAGFPGG